MQNIFITGIGTDIGKTVIAAIITEALQADYWKPIQAGFDDGTDKQRVQALVTNTTSRFYDEAYKLKLPASPHIAAREEGIIISLENIANHAKTFTSNTLIIEGAGGIMVPLNEDEFVIDLIKQLNAKVILVSLNYLGSINHSLLTASLCKQHNIDVVGWVFNSQYLNYEEEIVRWSSYPKIGSIPHCDNINSTFVQQQATLIQQNLMKYLHQIDDKS